jgi:predicted oxidoreductase
MLDKINLSKSDFEVSRLALGMWRINSIEPGHLDALLKTAIEQGISTFDHADIYGGYTCEEAFGKWMEKNNSVRENIQLISKCGIKLISANRPEHGVKHYDTSKAHIVRSVENSLANLKTDYLDMLLLHRPDPLLDPSEVNNVFDELYKSGKVRHFGVSNFSAKQYEFLKNNTSFPILTNQIEISLFKSEPLFDGTMDFFQNEGTQLMAWSPLGGIDNIKSIAENKLLTDLADKYSITTGDLVLAWLLHHPAVIIPVIGTMNTERLKNASKATKVILDRQDWFTLLEIVRGFEVA